MSEGGEQRTYEVERRPRAERDLRKLVPQIRGGILEAILALAEEPRPPGCVGYGDVRVFGSGSEIIE